MQALQLPTLYGAIQSECASSEKEAIEIMTLVHSAKAEDQLKAASVLNAKFGLLDKFFEGAILDEATMNDVGLKSGSFMSAKSANTGVSAMPIEFLGLDNWTNTLGIDTTWMQLFNMATIEGATEAHIIDWVNVLRHKQYDLGAPIESQAFSTDSATRFGRKRWGGASFADRSLLGTQVRYTLANLSRAHQLAELRLRADAAYTAQAAVSANGTTAFSTNIITTLNAAYVTLIEAMSTAGYQVTSSLPMYFLCDHAHKAAVLAAFRTIAGDNGTNQLLEFPIQPIFTANSNWPSTFAGTNAGMLIAPAQKQIWVNFSGPRVEQVLDPLRDGLALVYQYYFNFQCFGGQCQIVNLV